MIYGGQRELVHVKQHIRTYLKSRPESRKAALARASSDPTLCEAARMLRQLGRFDPVAALTHEFGSPDIKEGTPGEAVMELLLPLASNALVPL